MDQNFISLSIFSLFNFQISSSNSTKFLHNHVYHASLSRNQGLVWRIWSRIKQIEHKLMDMVFWNWVSFRWIQVLFLTSSFSRGLRKKIWNLWRLEHPVFDHCTSSKWNFDSLVLPFHVHKHVGLLMLMILIALDLDLVKYWAGYVDLKFWCWICFRSIHKYHEDLGLMIMTFEFLIERPFDPGMVC